MTKLYRDVLTALLDRHCPSVKVRRRAKQNAPWFDADCRTARRRARAAERRFQRSHSDVDRQAWAEKLRLLRTLYEQKNSDFWRGEITANKSDARRLWQTFKNVLRKTPIIRPTTMLTRLMTLLTFPGQSQDRPSIISCDAAVRCATQVNADHHRLECCDKRRSREADRITAKQDISVGHVTCERDARTPVTLHH